MKVRAYMTSTVLVAQATDSAREALENMALGDVRHLPVVDDEGRLQGVVSDRDLRLPAWAASAAGSEAAFEALTVGEVMTGFAVSVSPDADLLEAARIFVELRDRLGPLALIRLLGVATFGLGIGALLGRNWAAATGDYDTAYGLGSYAAISLAVYNILAAPVLLFGAIQTGSQGLWAGGVLHGVIALLFIFALVKRR